MTRTFFENDTLRHFDHSRSLEWIETNGLGGYASGTVSGAHSRRYHGLLVAATHPPVGRMIVLSKLDETIIVNNQKFELSANQYPGAVHPEGYQYLKSFNKDIFPEFLYQTGEIQIKKTIAAIHDENTTVIVYELLSGANTAKLELLPLYASRDFHGLAHANNAISKLFLFEYDVFRTKNYEGVPELFIQVPKATFSEQQFWFNNFQYSVEQYRGLDFQEDLYTHGKFTVELSKGKKLAIIISTEDPTGRDGLKLLAKEEKRREALVKDFSWDDDIKQLALATDQFVVKRGDDLKTIIAGYHWFSDWGRDTMISLPGITLVTGRHDDAKKILKAFAESVSEGMLPNRFPDYGEQPEYNTVDATLWFFHAIYKYYEYTDDKAFVKLLIPVLENILEWHYKGTRYGIKVDQSDELLSAGQDGVQLTWMDAKVGDWVVTPRKGKAVEINALWYNALNIFAYLLNELNRKKDAEPYRIKAQKVFESFNDKFWNDRQLCLYDYIDGTYCNDDLRPNQIYAVSLPFSILSKEKSQQVFDTVQNYLLTTRGLRSLSQSHKDYKPVYGGGVWSRDGSYHQGTVWSFLMGPYIDALIKLKGDRGKPEATRLFKTFCNHLAEAGIGTVSEIFDADAPHTSRGCMAQAWGVAEILRVALEHDLLLSPENAKKKSVMSSAL